MKWRENQVGFYFHQGDKQQEQVLNSEFLKENALQVQAVPTGYKDIMVVAVEFENKLKVDKFLSEFSFDENVDIARG